MRILSFVSFLLVGAAYGSPVAQPACLTLETKDLCHFPFNYKGVIYDKCTYVETINNKPWCATVPEVNITREGKVLFKSQFGDCDLESNCEVEVEGASCSEPFAVIGPCKAGFQRWSYNLETGICQPFLYGGCDGNNNNFHSKEACAATCQKSGASCSEPIAVRGPCRADLPRWSYNLETGICQLFLYGGCDGNNNNFHSKEACAATCQKSVEDCSEDTCTCHRHYKPVCAEDGEVYDNLCVYQCAKKKAACESKQGFPELVECNSSSQLGYISKFDSKQNDECQGKPCGEMCRLGVCNGHGFCVSPLENPCEQHGCDGKSCGDDCLLGDILGICDIKGYCDSFTRKAIESCNQQVEDCSEDACQCHRDYKPVCAEDGKVYGNLCEYQCAKKKAACGGIKREFPELEECNSSIEDCSEDTCQCPRLYKPVCAEDGEVYDNLCEYQCAKKKAACGGIKRGFPELEECNSSIEDCSEDTCPCPRHYKPVCAEDGEVYDNLCLYECAKKKAACKNKREFPELVECNSSSQLGYISKFDSKQNGASCSEPFAVIGPCKAGLPRWSYNLETGICQPFVYGGCQGNNNNFDSKEACAATCQKSGKECSSHKDCPEACTMNRKIPTCISWLEYQDEYFLIGKPCSSDEDCPEVCYAGRNPPTCGPALE